MLFLLSLAHFHESLANIGGRVNLVHVNGATVLEAHELRKFVEVGVDFVLLGDEEVVNYHRRLAEIQGGLSQVCIATDDRVLRRRLNCEDETLCELGSDVDNLRAVDAVKLVLQIL